MNFKDRQASGVFCEGQAGGDRDFYRVLNDLIWHIQAQSFDLKKFNALYMELLTSASHIFHLEEKLMTSEESSQPEPKQCSQYLLFSEQISRLNTLCRKRGISATNGMLTFLQKWFGARVEAFQCPPKNNTFEPATMIVNQ